MSPSSRPSLLRTTIGRTAVAGAAALVSVMGVAPAALADDTDTQPVDPTTGSTDTPTPDAPQQDAPQESTPQESTDQGTPSEGTPENTGSEQPTPQGADDNDSAERGDVSAQDVGDLPIASDDGPIDATAGEPKEIDVLANDASEERVTSLQATQDPQHGTLRVIGEPSPEETEPTNPTDPTDPTDPADETVLQSARLSIAAGDAGTLRFEYTADDDYEGTDSFTYTYTTASGTSQPAVVTINVAAAEEVEPVQPVFGEQKAFIGVQVKDGSYVEDGATTVGSVITIRVKPSTGPAYDLPSCTTVQFPLTVDPYYSFCPQDTTIPAGATATLTQTKAGTGLVKQPEPIVIEPCVENDAPGYRSCDDEGGPVPFGSVSAVFLNTGPLPKAVADRATTDQDEAVTIDVLRNDTSNDPDTDLDLASEPGHGTAEIIGEGDAPPVVPSVARSDVQLLAVPSAGSLKVRYTPDADFTGTDRFTYRLTNSNGSSTAQVTVRVVGGQVVPADSSSSGAVTGTLPDTGGSDVRLLGLGALLAGAGAVLARRRREDGVEIG